MSELEHLLELTLSATQAVLLQMKEDYPESSIQWMAKYDWQWPKAVPLNQIDYSNKASWSAQSDKMKIDVFKKKMTKGVLKPVILVRPLHAKKYIVVDGHHRALTSLELERPLMAWTVDVDAVNGPWDEMHSSQTRGSSIKASREDLDLILLAADSLQKASTPEPVGPNPLWHKHGPQWHLPYYIQHVANALIENGHSESNAIQMAVGVVRRWASGGGHVDKNTRAAASKAISEWEHLKSAAHAKMTAEEGDLFLTASEVAFTQHSVLDDLMLRFFNTEEQKCLS